MRYFAIRNHETGGIRLGYVLDDCPIPFDEACRKDTPVGEPYIVVPPEDVHDDEFFDALEADFTNPDGYGIGQDAWHAQDEANRLRLYIANKKSELMKGMENNAHTLWIKLQEDEINTLELELAMKNSLAASKMNLAMQRIDEAKKVNGQ